MSGKMLSTWRLNARVFAALLSLRGFARAIPGSKGQIGFWSAPELNRLHFPAWPKPRSLVNRMTLVHLFWAVLVYLSMIVGFWWSAHYLVEEGLKKQAVSWAGEFDELGTPLYFSDMPLILEQVRQRARHSPDILYARYYEAGSLKMLGQYVKKVTTATSFGWLSIDQVRDLRLDQASAPLIISHRAFLTVDSIRMLAPIQTRSLPVDSLFDQGSAGSKGEVRKTIGYLEIGVDLGPSRELIMHGMLTVSLFLGTVLLAAVVVSRYLVRSAMRPLLNLQAPLSRLANGDLNVVVADDSTYREIATINEAMRTSIAGLRQRDREMEIAMRGKLQAELASEAKSQFLAHLSHEVRTPLNGMLGFLGLLAKTPLNESQRAYLRDVEISSHRLLTMINDILDFSKIEAGKLALEHSPLNLRDVIEESVALYSANAHAQDLDLTLLFARDVPVELVGDAGRLTQVLCNLLANAVKFTHQGGIEVAVKLDLATDDDVLIQFSVTDSGIGIPPESLGRLFQPFSQADNSITRRYGGSGLGLVISRKLVEMMGGELRVESVSGKGSTFHFGARLQKRGGSAVVRPRSVLLETLGVLIVTPSSALAASLREDLLAWRMEDDAAASGEDGLKMLVAAAANGHPFDFVILDSAIKDLSPDDFVSRIQADPLLDALHLLLLQRTDEGLKAGDSVSPGFAAVLTKPVRGGELHSALVRAVAPLTDASVAQPTKYDILRQAKPAPPLRVLLADDDEISRRLATILLSKGGICVDQARNGVEAVEACRSNAYNLVLMDIQMPEMDGLTAAREIRKLDQDDRKVPIVALTANALRGDRERFLEAGMNGYLAKPVDAAILFETIAELCLNGRESLNRTHADESSTEPSADFQVLDPDAGVKRSGGDVERWRMLLDILTKELPGLLERSEKAFAEHRLDEVGKLAHKLRGGALYCSTPALLHAAEVLEQACREGAQEEEIRSRLDQLRSQAASLLGLIESGDLSGK